MGWTKITWPLLCSVGLGPKEKKRPPPNWEHHRGGTLQEEKLEYRHIPLNAHIVLCYNVLLSFEYVNISFSLTEDVHSKMLIINQKAFYKKNTNWRAIHALRLFGEKYSKLPHFTIYYFVIFTS